MHKQQRTHGVVASRSLIRQFSEELFLAIKHGKKRHRNWLERKMKRFTRNFNRRTHVQ